MSELSDVLQAIESLSSRGERMALATIVAVRGSTYRRPGARLLVPEVGAPIGNISGGCLEGDVADMARIVLSEGTARLAGWDLTADDDAVWGLGLGCNGAIEVFIEPAEQAAGVAHALRSALEGERPISVVTVLESGDDTVTPGSRVVVRPEGDPEGTLGLPSVDAEALAAARELLDAERSEVRTFANGVRTFVEVLEPPLRLLVCGAGHDAIPLVRAARSIGWSPIVIDDRPGFLDAERFPEASGFVLVEAPEHVAKATTIDRRTHAIVMTHNFLRDKEYLRSLLGTQAGYIGMLGPSARTHRLLMELADEGVEITAADRERIHGPAGLDLGAEGPEEIAQALVAEIVAAKHGRAGGFLKERSGPIHVRPAPGTEAAEARDRLPSMLIENEFTVATPVDDLWAYLLDVERIAPCLPGAELTETIDERRWKGKVNVKFGPVALSFAGTVEMIERNDEAHRAVLHAKGMEQKGKGAANATVTSWLEAAADGETTVKMTADISLTGAAAQLSRGLMPEISRKLTQQFADCLEATMRARAPVEEAMPAGSPAPVAATVAEPVGGIGVGLTALWAVVRNFFRRLVGGGKTEA